MAGEENLKERIRSGQTTIGVQVPYNATKSQIEDIYGKDDQYNYISVDSQHNPLNETDLVAVSQAAQDLSIPDQEHVLHLADRQLAGPWPKPD